MKKRLLSAIVSLCLLLTMAPTVAFAADGDDEGNTALATSGTCGAEDSNVNWNFDSDTGTLTISGKGAMEDYTGKTVPWVDQQADIKRVVIESDVTTIGSNAFMACKNLESVSIPEGLVTIGDRAFSQTGLKSIVIPASVTAIGPSVHEVFYQCYNLKNITVESGNTVYKSVDGVLYTADGTTLIQYPQNKADTSYKMIDEATKIEFLAFNYTQNLQTIDFNNVTTVADKGVYGNKALEEIVLPKVTTIGARAFCGNKAVTSLTLQTVPVSVGENAFSNCTSLANVTLPDEMTELTKGMFAECTELKSIQFPAQLTKIDDCCFDHAGLAGDLVIPASVTSIGNLAFRKCYGLTSITVEGTPAFRGSYMFQFCNNLLWMKANFNITKYFGNLGTPDQYKETVLQPQNSAWFTADGTEVNSQTSISEPTTFYRWFTKKIALSANGGKNNGDIKEVYAFFAPALGETEKIQFPERYYRGQENYVVKVDNANFTRDGYTFKEWTGDAAGTKPYAIGKYIYNYVPDAVYAQWNKIIDADTYFVYPTIEDQTYTGSGLEPEVKVTKNNEVINKGFDVTYADNTDVGQATATVKVGAEVIGTATFNIVKATPEIAISATPDTLTGGGSVELTVTGVPSEGILEVTCDNGISVTATETAGKYTAQLPNATKNYTFTAKYTGTDNYNDVEKTCVVKVTRKSSHSSSSGSSTTPTNTVSASTASNGKVSLDKSTAKKGNTVTVTVTPDAGYQLDKLTVTDAKGKTVDVTDKGNGKFTFTMPDSKVTITPTFSKIEDVKPSKTNFDDVASSAWYADAVQYVTDKGLMNGTDDNQFSPNASTTRGMLMTVLARYAGEDTTGGATWYEKGMEWAKAKGVSDGTNPNANITREQLVTMMYRYAGSPKADGKLDSFSDAASVSTYAASAMQWAVANGIVNGSNGKLNPQDNATRAQVAAILMRFCEMSK